MSLFITGTGTNVGKTVVTAGLAAVLHACGESFCVYKPIQTGSPDPARPEDLVQIQEWVGAKIPTHCTYCLPMPAAPYAADADRIIDPQRLLLDFKRLQQEYKTVLVEGAGGVRVPVAPQFEMIDLMDLFQLPTVVVAGPSLGTINQILLTLEALERRQLEVKGVVISGMPNPPLQDPAVATLRQTLEPFLNVPLLGVLPHWDIVPEFFSRASVLETFERLQLL
ncbi:MAG TPA: dethiobiotin synthase [Coleofasciculaceae cyanobacterium]|jgi:dethiobiotin synthetase